MIITTLSSQELSQNVSRAKRATQSGPVLITDHGKPTHVLLSFEDYQRIIKQQFNIADLLAMSNVAKIDFDAPRLNIQVRPADLS